MNNKTTERTSGLCVYCGAQPGTKTVYLNAARQLGTAVARAGISLIYGGGGRGIMGALADSALAEGGHVVGVIPRFMVEKEWAHERISDLQIVETMHDRKRTMANQALAHVALPGGFGTLEEIIEIFSWAQLGLHARPVLLANIDGYYNHLVKFFDTCVEEGFANARNRGSIRSTSTVDELLHILSKIEPSWGHLVKK